MAQVSYAGRVGQSGGVTGPHLHLGFLVDGQYRPLSQEGRSIAGNRIQFRLPNTQDWQTLYQPLGQGQLGLNPNVQIQDSFRIRPVHPVTGERNVPHRGEDLNLPFGTQLRVLGPGSMTPLANVGNAGNMSRFTGTTADNRPFTLEFMHLSELPQQSSTFQAQATGTPPSAPQLPPPEEKPITPEELKKQFEELLNKQLKDQMTYQMLQNTFAKQESPLAKLNRMFGAQPEDLGVLSNPFAT